MRNIINLTIGGLFNAVKNVAERSGFIKRGDNTRDLRGEEVTTSVPTDIPTATPEEKYKKFQAGRSKTQEAAPTTVEEKATLDNSVKDFVNDNGSRFHLLIEDLGNNPDIMEHGNIDNNKFNHALKNNNQYQILLIADAPNKEHLDNYIKKEVVKKQAQKEMEQREALFNRGKTQEASEPEIEVAPEPTAPPTTAQRQKATEKSYSKIENHQGWPVDKYMTMTPAVSNLPYYPKENVPNLSHEEYLLKTDRLFDISKLDDTIYVDEVSSKSYFLLKSKDLDINLANEVFKTHTENLHKLSDKHDILALLEKPDKDRTSQEKNILFSFSKSGTFLSEFTGEILKHRKENNFPINPNWEKQSRELQKKINKKLEVDENNDSFKIDITYSSYPR